MPSHSVGVKDESRLVNGSGFDVGLGVAWGRYKGLTGPGSGFGTGFGSGMVVGSDPDAVTGSGSLVAAGASSVSGRSSRPGNGAGEAACANLLHSVICLS